MDRALEADPGNLEVLLSLGVSHTNELDQSEALSYLHRWLTQHPSHGALAATAAGPPDSSQRHSYVVCRPSTPPRAPGAAGLQLWGLMANFAEPVALLRLWAQHESPQHDGGVPAPYCVMDHVHSESARNLSRSSNPSKWQLRAASRLLRDRC